MSARAHALAHTKRADVLQGEYPHLADDLDEGGLRHGEERREPGMQSAVPLPSSGAREREIWGMEWMDGAVPRRERSDLALIETTGK